MAALRYSGPFLFLASIPLLHGLAPAAPFATVVLILFSLVVAERFSRPQSNKTHAAAGHLLPILYIPAQLGVTLWAAHRASRPDAGGWEFAGLVISVGATTGIFGVLAAHEMVHSRSRAKQALGRVMLSAMTYRHFDIAHVYGHHRWAGTERDASTARRGENLYVFFLRTLVRQIAMVYEFERRRCAKKSFAYLRNRLWRDAAIMSAIYAALWLGWGRMAAIFFALESLVGIFVLEVFNYTAHYGLMRRRTASGALEPMSHRHAWNSSAPAANLLIFNMGRHSDHHARAAAVFDALEPMDGAPELPASYAGSIVMALIPPLWRRVMDGELDRIEANNPIAHPA
ncbi:MAG TPA: alkane 1-monooxygenase [Rhizomicrobium sp.]|nr:alkane 1-monooxygenase [Rhizomicrobium sp.]